MNTGWNFPPEQRNRPQPRRLNGHFRLSEVESGREIEAYPVGTLWYRIKWYVKRCFNSK